MTLDLEGLYKSIAGKPLPRGMLGGSSDALARRLPRTNRIQQVPTDVAGIQELAAQLKEHLALVCSAREKLRALVATRFSIEDLLHVGSKTFNDLNRRAEPFQKEVFLGRKSVTGACSDPV